ncbi:MAG TPA: NTP transferase domain-containing protein [Nitrososphaeraceae archaeon]|jgi:adenosylcobinamide-phosphate guanylyltransferase|nr:NTP transferase domain-containing protein [Nitrososphaeraceae archaeon]
MNRPMMAAIMCGGKGSRMNQELTFEKPMLLFRGKPMVGHVLDALVSSKRFSSVVGITSRHTTATSKYLRNLNNCVNGLHLIETSGFDYSTDLGQVIEMLKPSEIIVVPSDLPILKAETINDILKSWNPEASFVSIIMEKSFIESMGLIPSIVISVEKVEYCYSGISMIDTSRILAGVEANESYIVMNRADIAFNINTMEDLKAAKAYLN